MCVVPERPRPPLSDPSWDLSGCPPVRRVVVIASQMRSGSSLVARTLGRTGLVGVPDEYLLPLHLAAFRDRLGVPLPSLAGRVGRLRRRVKGDPNWRWTEHCTRRSLRAYLERVARLRTTPNGVFGIKVQVGQLAVLRNAGLDLDAWGPEPEFVALDRLDRVAQAVSQERTRQEGVYASDQARDPSLALHYDEARLRVEVERFDDGGREWDRYFAQRGVEPLRVTYEQLDADFASTMRRVFDHIGLADVAVGEPPLQRVRDDVNEAWSRRLRAALAGDRST